MGQLTIQSLERARFGVSRSTLQRLLKRLVDRKVIKRSGATHRVVYTPYPPLDSKEKPCK